MHGKPLHEDPEDEGVVRREDHLQDDEREDGRKGAREFHTPTSQKESTTARRGGLARGLPPSRPPGPLGPS
ncbi:hypothetical protein TthAA22_05690 [Thermus thermophilus]|nr:hypothetical protein TthAA22_05690 [Thermus thermophilus]